MARSAQNVFDTAIALIDEVDETGATDTSDTLEYKNRTVHILNILIQELYPYSATYRKPTSGKRSTARIISKMADYLDLDDYISTAVIPYGLAAHLLLEENPTAANYFQQRYDELKARLREGFGLLAESEDIEDVYSNSSNGIGIEWTTRWYRRVSRWQLLLMLRPKQALRRLLLSMLRQILLRRKLRLQEKPR